MSAAPACYFPNSLRSAAITVAILVAVTLVAKWILRWVSPCGARQAAPRQAVPAPHDYTPAEVVQAVFALPPGSSGTLHIDSRPPVRISLDNHGTWSCSSVCGSGTWAELGGRLSDMVQGARRGALYVGPDGQRCRYTVPQ